MTDTTSGDSLTAGLDAVLAALRAVDPVAAERIESENRRVFLPDGFQAECSPGYHCMPAMFIVDLCRLRQATGRPFPDGWLTDLEQWLAVPAYMARPDLVMPYLNDRSLVHRRRIFYVKGRYWILRDDVLGSGHHRVEQVFHVAPVRDSKANTFFPGELRVDGLHVVTVNPGVRRTGATAHSRRRFRTFRRLAGVEGE